MTTESQNKPREYTAKELEALKKSALFYVKDGIKSWTPESIKRATPSQLIGVAAILDADQPAISQLLLPQGMTLQTYDRMLNREISRREMWPQYYQYSIEIVAAGTSRKVNIPELAAALELGRPKIKMDGSGIEFDGKNDVAIKADPMTVALYDALIDTMISNKSGLVLRDDTAKALGHKPRKDGKAWNGSPNTDVADHRLMYAVGSLKYYNPTPGVGDGTEAAFSLTPGLTNGQLQNAFCNLTPKLYEKGRSDALPGPRDAGLAGLLEARVDARTGGFETNDLPPDGLFQLCSVPMASAEETKGSIKSLLAGR